ncbi:MAG: glycoside hydrolase N-terminal domain-containing protein [Clostridia bacterium]|nr:glycoside hydrolase N-terminal domain-containing protein [Clostridia bacterium]
MPRDVIVLKRPASREKDMWKEALPIGCGITGGLILGAIEKEQVIITRHDLWHRWGNILPVPDISDSFKQMRKKIDEGKYLDACHMMENALREKEFYKTGAPSPFPLGSLKLSYVTDGVTFKHYRRGIELEKALAFVSWTDQRGLSKREYFASRESGILYTRVTADFDASYEIDFDFYDNLDGISKNEAERRREKLTKEFSDNGIFYAANTDGQDFGALISVTSESGTVKRSEKGILVTGRDFTVKLLSFAKVDRKEAFLLLNEKINNSKDFDEALKAHSLLHKELYGRVSIFLTEDTDERIDYTNEELLDEAYEDEASDAFLEKIWRFGRYLFISAIHSDANPFPLYGLWPGANDLPWTAHVCNENVQCMYWHTLTGNLSESIKNLIDYYHKKMPDMKENAKKLFGCRGIFVPVYSYPETLDGKDYTPPHPIVPVILNWISGAAWLSKHFYDYFIYTKDEVTLNEKILPFMIETAQFYEDYITYDKNGRMRIYPSVSPENSPGNLVKLNPTGALGHPCPAVENATMDFALMKEVICNLLKLTESVYCRTIIPKESIENWKKLISEIPGYEINEDGAVKEWMSPELSDNYDHRHFSHLYPVFPGTEVTSENNLRLAKAFKKAGEKRISGAMSGWSFPHLGLIHTRFGEGNEALGKIITMAKGIVLDNFFTLHNDWRHMGTGINVDHMTPVQLDALMGTVALIQDMLFQYNDGVLKIFPALPERIKFAEINDFVFPEGKVSFSLKDNKVSVKITAIKDTDMTVLIFKEKKLLKLKKDIPLDFTVINS